MKPIKSDVAEEICPACNGTGFVPVIKKPAPGKRIFGPRCTKCGGKITDQLHERSQCPDTGQCQMLAVNEKVP